MGEDKKDFWTNKKNTDYPETVRDTYNYLWKLFSYSARIPIFWDLLLAVIGKKEYDILDYRTLHNGEFMSWLIDRMIEWNEGKDVNFSEIYRAILTAGEFSGSEKLIFETCDIEERLWAIFLVVSCPGQLL